MQGGLEWYEFEDIFGTDRNPSSNVQYERSSNAPTQTTTQERELIQPPLGTQKIDSDNFYAENQATVSRNETCKLPFLGSDDRHFLKGSKWTERNLGSQNPSGSSALSDVSEVAQIGQVAFTENTAPIFFGPGTSLSSGVESMEYSKVSGKFSCFECEMIFTSEYHLEMHFKIHAKPEQFPVSSPSPSGFVFHSQSSLDNGGNCFSSEDDIFDTGNESSRVASEIKRKNRIRKSKYREKIIRMERFKCDNCQKVFSDNFKLKQHERTHSGERPYECDVCNFAFTQKFHLTRHMVVHKKENLLE